MDSGNTSGSMQSSSGGGDEEYDSRAAVDPTFISTNNHRSQSSNSSSSLLFDPTNLSNFFNNNNNHLDHNMVWPRPVIRSDPIPSDLVNAITQSQTGNSLSSNFPQPVLHNLTAQTHPNISNTISSLPTLNPPPNDNNGAVVRNPKKRSRASRRAPTTVLTTDTTNFRAMVQEFTGIPAPPFTSSPFPRTRLDLFGSGSGSRSGLSMDHHLNNPNLLRPFAHKAQQTTIPSFVVQSNPTGMGFNSLLQGPPRFPILPIKSNSSTVLEDNNNHFGLTHGMHVNNPFTTNWVGGVTNNNQGILGLNDNSTNRNDSNSNSTSVDHEAFLRSINGGYVSTASASEQVISTSNGKTTTDFRVSTNKTTENNGSSVVAVARTEVLE